MRKLKRERENSQTPSLSRRGFLSTVGVGAVGASVLSPESGALPLESASSGEAAPVKALMEGPASPAVSLSFVVNGKPCQLEVEPRHTLLDVLREKLLLTGTKPGCERGECGACTVLINGIPRYSCLTLAREAEGTEVITVEGLKEGEKPGKVQQAFMEEDGFQCGYCTPGQVMAAEGVLRANPNPTLDEIRLGMSGNLCRCGAYAHIFRSVQRAAELKKGRS
jgi:xanthine dehydrogenase YagT iron-sulfur-binding subunit